MKKFLPHTAVMLFVFVAACFLTYQITFTETDKFWKEKIDGMLATDTSAMSKSLGELADAVGERCIYEINPENSSDAVKDGYVSSLGDRYSMYMDIDEHNNYLSFAEETSNVGLGVSTLYNAEHDGICVMNVFEGSPAEKKGIVPGDMILTVDGEDVSKLGYYGAMCRLGLGDAGDAIKLGIRKHDGSVAELELEKNEVNVKNIKVENLKNSIGFIRIESFEKGSMDDFKSGLESLLKSGCERFVIDVRNNTGGDIEEIYSILDFLIGEGNLFTIYTKTGAADTRVSKHKSVPYPMAVLVNERTVCGAEVFAGTLSAFDIAELVGTKTCGKATVQTLTEFSDGSAVSLSTVKYVIGTSIDFDAKGLVPGIEAPLSQEALMRFTALKKAEDTQLQTAVAYLKEQKVNYAND